MSVKLQDLLVAAIATIVVFFVLLVVLSSCGTNNATKAEIEELHITLHVKHEDYKELSLFSETRRECEKEYYEFIGSKYANDEKYAEIKASLKKQMELSQRNLATALLGMASSNEVNCERVQESILKHSNYEYRMLWTNTLLDADVKLY